MLRIVILFIVVKLISTSLAEECYNCASVPNYTWQQIPFWQNNQYSNDLKISSDCNDKPYSIGGTTTCNSMCFKWQFNYTTTNGESVYETVRGCAEQLLLQSPSREYCPGPQHTFGVIHSGSYQLCYCEGNYCNSAMKTTTVGIGTMILIAFQAFIRR